MRAIKPIHIYAFLTLINLAVFTSYIVMPNIADHKQQQQMQSFLR